MKILILVFMFFLHIVDDYYLQGILAKMKMKDWWREQTNKPLYNYDYLMALFEHAFSWAFVIMSPIIILMIHYNDYHLVSNYIILLISNTIIHAIVDDLKANKYCINLIIDQSIHFAQIIITWFIFFILRELI